MQECTNCRQPRTSANKFCTKCGTRFPDDAPAHGNGPITARRSPYRPVAIGVAGAVLLAGVGYGSWYLTHRGSSANGQHNTANGVGAASAGHGGSAAIAAGTPVPETTAPQTPVRSSPAGSSPSINPAPPGPVAISPALAGNPEAPAIAAFLDKYFSAINAHDYQAYTALLGPQTQVPDQSQFDSGYGSTTDSSETLRGISSAAGGDSAAQVTFTSHQDATESPTNTTCTKWSVSIYLTPQSGSYLLDKPPSSYLANYSACP